MSTQAKILITIAVVLIVIWAYFYFTRGKSPTKKQKDTLAVCISKSGAKFYGTQTCPHCIAQKEKFGDDAKYLPLVDCSANPQACMDAKIEAYPTWIIKGKKHVGELEPARLAELTGC